MPPPSALRRFHLAEYSDADGYRHYLASKVGLRTVEFPSGTRDFYCNVNYAPMQQLALFAYTHRSDLVVHTPSEDIYRYQICRAGEVDVTARGQSIRLQPGHAVLLTNKTNIRVRYSANSEQIILRTGSAVLKSRLQAITGTRPAGDIVFDSALNVETSEASSLRSLAAHLIGVLDAGGTLNSTAAIELENMAVTMFLLGKRHNYSAMLAAQPKSSAPFQVRLAEEYIEANWDRPITIETLTEVTGVSARSLFERFQNYRGISPIAFLRQVRLQNARKMLISPKPDTTVTGVALACGFLNTGHFARHYREAFGELPSKVLAASRSLVMVMIGWCVAATTSGWFNVKAEVIETLGL